MINPMNARVPGIKQTTLHGKHEAHNVYCKDLVFKHGAGTLYCRDIFINVDWATIDEKKLNHEDRYFDGVLYVEDAFIGETHRGLNPPEVEDDSED